MAIPITRKDKIITAHDVGGRILRAHECQTVRSAVALEIKLNSDTAFASHWAHTVELRFPPN